MELACFSLACFLLLSTTRSVVCRYFILFSKCQISKSFLKHTWVHIIEHSHAKAAAVLAFDKEAWKF